MFSNLHWASNLEIVFFIIYLVGAIVMLTIALRGTFTCPRKLSQSVRGVLCEMAANGDNKSFMVYVVYTLVVGGIALLFKWKIFAIMITVCAILSYVQAKIFTIRRCHFKVKEQKRKESERAELSE